MAQLKWTPDLSVGISEIDRQHRRIVDYINRLDEIGRHGERSQILGVIEELTEYTHSHFQFEEDLLEQSGYELVNGHRRIHQMFIKRVEGFRMKFRGGEDIAMELQEMLVNWLRTHIRNEDGAYAERVRNHLIAQGVDLGEEKAGWFQSALGRFFSGGA